MSEKPNYYGILPANVRYDKNLKPNAKLLYSELTCLSSKEGYCYASNNYFAELYEVDPSSISKWIKQLADFGYITVEYIYEGKECKERRIILNNCISSNTEYSNSIAKNQEGYCQNAKRGIAKNQEGYCQNAKDNNTRVNNTSINNINSHSNNYINNNADNSEEIQRVCVDKDFTQPQQNYAKTILEIYKNADLPCWNGDYLSFIQHDFKNAITEIREYHSDDVIQACKNYIKILRDPKYWPSYEMRFDNFVKSTLFKDCLPCNFREQNFIIQNKPKEKKPNNLKDIILLEV